MRNVGASWSSTKSIRYHMYLIHHENKLSDAVAFGYEWSFNKADAPILPMSPVFEVPN